MKIEDIKEYRLIKKKAVPDLNSEGYLLKHKKTGARVFILSNDDRNKVFYIAFRTPPEDSCGTPHILEHTVLCGSDRYKAKDPFIELAKGSLNTFLNAMTYPDKTVFPVASTNDKDFKNLSDVYMDAVLHPAIYANKKIFMQEGWHYEMESETDPIRYNGVVYNEMKGAYSSPDDVLDRYTYTSLYPDTPYPVAVVLGCDPATILGAVTPVPDTLSEYQFAGLLRGSRTELVKCIGNDLQVPARAEIVLEGVIHPDEVALEGPYGDHTGYYNEQDYFPVFTVERITMRENPIYHSTYTGKPPDEPAVLGVA